MELDGTTSSGAAGSSRRSEIIPPSPWWKHGHVWLLISGPAAVVVAGLLTAWVAVAGQDPVVDADYYRHGIEINKQLARDRALMPAVQGRNHAATPVQP